MKTVEPRTSAMPGRILSLDGVRGIAIIMVLCVHFFRDHGQVALAIGVDVFFVLSGFLITQLLLSESGGPGQVNYRSFVIRRMGRLVPALIVLAGVYLLTGALILDTPPRLVLAEVVAALTFTYPFLAATRADSGLAILPMWSLSVEVWFYLWWPLILGWTQRGRFQLSLKQVAVILIILCVSIQALRAFTAEGPAVILHRIRVDLLGIGAIWAILGEVWKAPKSSDATDQSEARSAFPIRNKKFIFAAASAALPLLFFTAVLSRPFPYDIDAGVGLLPEPIARFFGPWGGPGFALAMWCIGALLLVAYNRQNHWAVQVTSWKPLVWFGVVSYSLYLWHYPIAELIYRRGPDIVRWHSDGVDLWGAAIYFVACLIPSLLVGWASYRFIERSAWIGRLVKRPIDESHKAPANR